MPRAPKSSDPRRVSVLNEAPSHVLGAIDEVLIAITREPPSVESVAGFVEDAEQLFARHPEGIAVLIVPRAPRPALRPGVPRAVVQAWRRLMPCLRSAAVLIRSGGVAGALQRGLISPLVNSRPSALPVKLSSSPYDAAEGIVRHGSCSAPGGTARKETEFPRFRRAGRSGGLARSRLLSGEEPALIAAMAVPPYQRVDARELPGEVLEKLRARATGLGATRTGLASEQLGCVALLAIAGVVALLVGVGRVVQSGVDWVAVVAPLAGLAALLAAFALVQARRTSPVPEFTLTTHAYHLVSDGAGTIEAYCMPLCTGVEFVTVLQNGLYNHSVLEAHFGAQKVVLTDTLPSPLRERPWEGERFAAFLAMIEGALRDLEQGRWVAVSGSDLLPGEPPRPSSAAPGAWRRPPQTRMG